MKRLLLTIILTGLLFSAYSQDKYEPTDTAMITGIEKEIALDKFSTQNNYAFGLYGSSKLPLGYQMFFNLENLGRIKTNLGFLFYNQFSNHSNYDISCLVLKKKLLLNRSSVKDIVNLNFRTRKLHFSDRERVTVNYKGSYGVIVDNRYNIGVGIDCERGKENMNGLLLTAGKFFPLTRINLTAQSSLFKNRIDYKAGITKTFSFGSPVIYGIEIFYEEYRGYNDVSLGLMIYL